MPDAAARPGGAAAGPRRKRRPTATSTFGSGRREAHDASGFYGRFSPPELSDSTQLGSSTVVDRVIQADARRMVDVADDSIALVVTSPPYFAGKDYELELGREGVPATYLEYLALLRDVFAECKRVLEPGGRIAVNVANLGRRPYRSLSGDVAGILQDDLGLLLRGEVIWWKGRAAGGSCAWGTFQSPANPVLRDVTERVVVASKGRFDRALTSAQRSQVGRPSAATISRDEFLEATTDIWELPAESARRVGHPAPFPVDLPRRLIELYTYEGDVVLDPFGGSGSTAVAAVRTGRHYLCYDTDADYCEAARRRIAGETEQASSPVQLELASPPLRVGGPTNLAVREGRQAKEVAGILLAECGFTDIASRVRVPDAGVEVDLVARDRAGAAWAFDVCGTFTSGHRGLRQVDALWRAVGKASVLAAVGGAPFVVLTTGSPPRGSSGAKTLRAVTGPGRPIRDVIELLDPQGQARLGGYAAGGAA
ncbi:MAG TPA: site-specific DNA-methyltransferase [Acidimicrobiales bacterium]|nr:site-specific DNA-methyltransferase [Acidimicrobiales bacterium]